MIAHEDAYYRWLERQGVGAKDRVASSPASYVSYLNSVSTLVDEDISPSLLASEGDIEKIRRRIDGMRAPNTIGNYVSAMRQYAAMVKAEAYR